MKTKADKEFPEIEWERGDLQETDDYMKFYGCSGESADGRKYEGTWEVCGGEFSDITHIYEA